MGVLKVNHFCVKKNSFLCFFVFITSFSAAAQNHYHEKPENYEKNLKCLNCHGHHYFDYYNKWFERDVRDRMNPYFVIDTIRFYESNHRTFECTDCHSEEYNTFPHSGELRMEEKLTCLDCHGGDEDYKHFQFEKLEEEFNSSVHATKHNLNFTCWMCHNPHSYKVSARMNYKIKEIITYDNEICLSCHSNINKYQLITDLINPNIIEKHDWLPNQNLHMQNVRCIECHAEINNEVLVAHNIQPKEKAVKNCVQCHSKNSILMASLYKYQFTGQRNKIGFYNSAMLDEQYVIGANRNYYLNIFSLFFFGFTLFGIVVHGFLRILLIKK